MVAYFCAEYALDGLSFAGGLGVLAGDYILECGKENFPLVAVGMFYHEKQASPEVFGFELQTVQITVEISGQETQCQVWKKNYGSVPLYLLSTETDITRVLYDDDTLQKFRQQVILGVGGVKLLRELKINVDCYHLNEGHAAFALLELAREVPGATLEEKLNSVSQKVVATKHTILHGAGLHLTREELKTVLGSDEIYDLAPDPGLENRFSATGFFLKYSRVGNAVSAAHADFEKRVHPNSTLLTITNGVNLDRWQDKRVKSGPNLWQTHETLRGEMVSFINQKCGSQLNPKALTVVWARRLALYKRPELLLTFPEKLAKILGEENKPIQIVIASQPASYDKDGQEIARRIGDFGKTWFFKDKLVYLPEYNLEVAKVLTAGADVWLNTPTVGIEASGTSGMKAGANGGLVASSNDGWVREVDWKATGWLLPEENTAEFVYYLLDSELRETFYGRDAENVPTAWVERMEKTIKIVEEKFTTTRMLKDYREKMYLE